MNFLEVYSPDGKDGDEAIGMTGKFEYHRTGKGLWTGYGWDCHKKGCHASGNYFVTRAEAARANVTHSKEDHGK